MLPLPGLNPVLTVPTLASQLFLLPCLALVGVKPGLVILAQSDLNPLLCRVYRCLLLWTGPMGVTTHTGGQQRWCFSLLAVLG